ncbi:MAG: T9SS type A sorting domain-containing protein [Bacteroidetes bacterium]|nr:T9SS type A sorting domain-containing protein [Bacteroidota bacterium]
MKKIVLCSFVALSMMGVSAQAQSIRCSTMENLERLKLADPTLESRMAKIEKQSQQIISKSGGQGSLELASIINIPVVVHVLYKTAEQNISNAQIQSQIDVLNEDFRRLNSDKTNTPSGFVSGAADAEITFCLASIDPNGGATTGIIRKATSVSSFSDNDGAKYASYGGDNAWPSDSYLNIWVCNLGGGLLGYAQFPGGPASTDGVVINYNHFGRGFATGAPYNKGRTATHEVGHWLNLRHIWGDANCGNDLVNDTPTQQTSNYGCPSFPNVTCSNTINGDQFMNYMDYTDDGCMNMFSLGQKSRMKSLFVSGNARADLALSSACGGSAPVPPSTSSSAVLTIGTGIGTMVAPYGTYYMDEKSQFIITKSELVAAGYSVVQNVIEALAFNVQSASGQAMQNFTIKMGATTLSSFSSNTYLDNSDMTTVYSASQTVVTGWNTHTFTTPFTYSGTGNLAIEICWDNSAYTTDSKVYCTSLPTSKTIFKQQDVTSGGICSATIGTKGLNRPNIRLTVGSTPLEDRASAIDDIKLPEVTFAVYPNPASSFLNINYQIASDNSTVTFSVYNMMGALISSLTEQSISAGEQSLSLDFSSNDNMSDGIYLLSLNVNGTVQTKRFVLKR